MALSSSHPAYIGHVHLYRIARDRWPIKRHYLHSIHLVNISSCTDGISVKFSISITLGWSGGEVNDTVNIGY